MTPPWILPQNGTEEEYREGYNLLYTQDTQQEAQLRVRKLSAASAPRIRIGQRARLDEKGEKGEKESPQDRKWRKHSRRRER